MADDASGAPRGTRRFLRFLLSGGINTAATYALYLLLLYWLPYGISYSMAYVAGIFISYVLNRLFVFQSHQGVRSVVLFPFVYVAQYLAGIFLLWLCVDILGVDKTLAPAFTIVVTIPLTYLLTKLVFVPCRRG